MNQILKYAKYFFEIGKLIHKLVKARFPILGCFVNQLRGEEIISFVEGNAAMITLSPENSSCFVLIQSCSKFDKIRQRS